MKPYVSRFSGEWVKRNKNGHSTGSGLKDWLHQTPLYVSVFNMADDYIIKVGYNRRGAAMRLMNVKTAKKQR